MIVSIMQPAFLPWLGYFNRLAMCDLHIVLDHVQIDKSSKTNFANRNKLRTREGWTWVGVPIQRKGLSGQLALNEIRISEEPDWARKMMATIEHNYARAPHFTDYAPAFRNLIARDWTALYDIASASTDALRAAFSIETPMRRSSELGIASTKDELILDLVRAVGGSHYISGPFGRDYLMPEKFAAAGIELLFHDYEHPNYSQAFPGFEPYMSALDLLFNLGPEARAVVTRPQPLARS